MMTITRIKEKWTGDLGFSCRGPQPWNPLWLVTLTCCFSVSVSSHMFVCIRCMPPPFLLEAPWLLFVWDRVWGPRHLPVSASLALGWPTCHQSWILAFSVDSGDCTQTSTSPAKPTPEPLLYFKLLVILILIKCFNWTVPWSSMKTNQILIKDMSKSRGGGIR